MRATISRAEIFAICRMLGATPDLVRHIEIDPGGVQVTVFRLDEQGCKYVGADGTAAEQVTTIPLVGDNGAETVRMRHPDLPGQEINVRPRGVGQRAMAGWEVVDPPPEPPKKDPPPVRGKKPEAPAESGASSSPPPRGRRASKGSES